MLLRILLVPIEPARPTPTDEALVDELTLPAAPMPIAKMPASIWASTVIAPPERIDADSSSARVSLGSASVPMVLIANEPATAAEAAVPLPPPARLTDSAPAPATILALLEALMLTAPGATMVLMPRTAAMVSTST